MCLVSSAQTRALLKGWLPTIIHPTQCSTNKGTYAALAQVSLHAEVCHKTGPVYGLAVDFAKLFNTISVPVLKHVVRLDFNHRLMSRYSYLLMWPRCFGGFHTDRCVRTVDLGSREIPRGLSVSVLGAELLICLFLHQLHGCVKATTASYVDDVNVMTVDAQQIEMALFILFQVVDDFQLDLSRDKLYLWGSCESHLIDIGKRWGLRVQNVETLGLQWRLT